MPKLRLTDADRKRLGVDEDLPVDVFSVTNREALGLVRLGFKTPALWREVLLAEDRKGDNADPLAWTGLVWIGLRRIGVEVDIETLEFDFDGVGTIRDEDPPEREEGKAPGHDPSTSSPSPSSTGTATSKPRSKARSSRS
ncbi:MAG: hypothetical protein ACM30G_17575 [Micromonosporaceae bacterium]